MKKLDEAAVLADEYVLTHKRAFESRWVNSQAKTGNFSKNKQPTAGDTNSPQQTPPVNPSGSPSRKAAITCFYCKKVGHKKSDCFPLNKRGKTAKPVGLITSCEPGKSCRQCDTNSEGSLASIKGYEEGSGQTDYTPFITEGLVSLPGQLYGVPIRILRDTGAAQSFLLAGVVPLSDHTTTGTHVLVRGFEMTPVHVPLHQVHLTSKLVTGNVIVGVRSFLPVPGVSFILGNDLAEGNVWGGSDVVSLPIVMTVPEDPGKSDECLRRQISIVLSLALLQNG